MVESARRGDADKPSGGVNEGTIRTAFSTNQTPVMLQYLRILLME